MMKNKSSLKLKKILRYIGHLKRFIVASSSLLPVLYYGNTAGFLNNFLARLQIRKFQKNISLNDFGEFNHGKVNAERLRQKGYVFLPRNNTYNVALKKLKYYISSCISNNNNCAVSPNGATVYVLDPEKIAVVSDFLTEEIKSIIFSYYKTGFYIKSVRIWRNSHVAAIDPRTTDVFSNTFHHDNTYVTGLRVFIYLNDNVNSRTGALKLHNISTSKKFVRSLKFFQRDLLMNSVVEQLNTSKSLKYFEGNSGDVAIANVQECLHSASVPGFNSQRDVLQFEIYPSNKLEKDARTLLDKVPRDILLDPYRV